MIQPRNNFTQSEEYKKGSFSVGEGDNVYKGYSADMYWNGWECPCFDKEESVNIINECLNIYDKGGYDAENDRFWIQFEGDSEEEISYHEGKDIIVNGEVKHVYDIGAFAWCWEKEEDENSTLTNKQKELMYKLYSVYMEMVEEYHNDENFRNVLDDNNDLIPMSMDELASEWYALAEGDRKK